MTRPAASLALLLGTAIAGCGQIWIGGDVGPATRSDECGNGIDDDADGRIDDGCPCASGEVRSCFSGAHASSAVGVCAVGTRLCDPPAEWGDWGDYTCEGDRLPDVDERCSDGVDDDCDGAVDEGCDCASIETLPCGPGASVAPPCSTGLQSCRGGVWSGCEGAVAPSPDVCGDGIDNDCDGTIDDRCFCVPSPEACGDGIDNDCDGERDETACMRPAGPTALGQRASAMEPGSWARLETEGLDSMLTTALPPARALPVFGWSDDAHWDSRTGQLFWLGLRRTRKMIAYAEDTNRWRDIPLDGVPNAPPFGVFYGYTHGNNALDIERSRFYHLSGGVGVSYYDIVSERWFALPEGGEYPSAGCIEYFSARRELVLDRDLLFDDIAGAWLTAEAPPVQGYLGLARHNPMREEVLFAGGNETPRVIARRRADGAIERLPDLPFDTGVSADKITVDPRSGVYLLLDYAARDLWELDPETFAYRLVDDFSVTPWPFGYGEHPVVAFVPEHGVTMWITPSRVMLYRHDR
jgi:hypothetical protein